MFETERVEHINNNDWYISNFSSLIELYNYLESNPKINRRVFSIFSSPSVFVNYIMTTPLPRFKLYDLSSKSKENDFNGLSYETSLECLRGNLDSSLKINMDKFLELAKDLEAKYKISESNFTRIHGVYGSVPDVNAYLRGKPNNMIRMERTKENKVVDIHFNLAYPHYTKEEQIINRGIIVINLIKLLEKNNYRVRFNTYMLVKINKEIVYIKVILKKDGETLNIGKCFFPLCCKEFLRRIMFRVIESKNVKEIEWHHSYGENVGAIETKKLLKISNDDIIVTYPSDMGINGRNLYSDAENFMEQIDLKKYIKVKR